MPAARQKVRRRQTSALALSPPIYPEARTPPHSNSYTLVRTAASSRCTPRHSLAPSALWPLQSPKRRSPSPAVVNGGRDHLRLGKAHASFGRKPRRCVMARATTNRRFSRRSARRRSASLATSIASPSMFHQRTARHTLASSTCGLRFILLQAHKTRRGG